MNQKLLTKVLATTLAVILTFANFVMLGVYASNSYATQDELETQKTVSKDQNIEFDAYFMSDKQNKSHTSKIDMDASTKLYLNVSAKNGYLKNAKIAITGENNTDSNFEIVSGSELSDSIESIDKNVISLKQINNGTQVVLEVPIKSIKQDLFDLSNFSKINNITLTGSYVNNEGKQIAVSQTINVRNEWTKEVKAVIEQEEKTYIPYTNGEQTGTILQTLIKTGLENNSLPIKQTKLTVKVPEINGVKPEEVIVTAAGTYATNNQGQEKFTSDNWSYDEATGLITITVNNEANENKVAWNKQAKDEYVITYKFSEKLETIKAEQTAEVTITPYNNEIKEQNETNTLNIEENQIKGNFVQTNITSVDALSKGYLYTKADKEISYNEKQTVEVTYANILDSIIIENNIDNFVSNDGATTPTTVSNTNYAYYKTTKISKENFEKILGTEGSITLTGENGEKLTVINKDTALDENGYYVYTYTEETNQIKITTTKPVSAGTLEITHEKSLKGKTDYNRVQVESFQTLQLKATVTALNSNTEIAKVEGVKDITLIAPSTKIEASVSNSNLSTVVKNENVEFRVILKTNDITCDLFKNPVVEILLPSYIKELNIKDVNLLYDKELQIESRKTYVNNTGNIVIQVILKGEDTIYNQDEISKGANLVINTDITLKNLTPTTEDVMKVYVTNENVTTYENTNTANQPKMARTLKAAAPSSQASKAYVETTLKAVAPVGMVTTNGITGYNSKNETVTSMSGNEQTGKLEVGKEARTATVTMNVINNYENPVTNVSILGRIPFEGNKNILTGEDLGSNLNLTLAGFNAPVGIDANKVTIYYSENPDATKDLNNTENKWQTQITSNTKSYLIVLNDYEMATGTALTFSYNINIPENISHNKTAYATHVVYFDNITKARAVENDKQEATKIGLTTGAGPELKVTLETDYEDNEEIQEGKIIEYTVIVKNTGKSEVSNITVTGNIPEGSVYTYFEGEEDSELGIEQLYDKNKKQYVETIESLQPGEEEYIRYMVQTNSLTHNESGQLNEVTLTGTASVTAEGTDTVFNSNTVTNKVTEGFINAELRIEPLSNVYDREENEEITYYLEYKNVTSKDMENVQIKDVLPEGLTFVSASQDGKYDEKTRTLTWTINKLSANRANTIYFKAKTNKLPENEYQKEIENKMEITNGSKTVQTTSKIRITKPALSVELTTDTKNTTVSVGDAITYNVTIKNTGAGQANGINVSDTLPKELKLVNATYTKNGKTSKSYVYDGEKLFAYVGSLSEGETINLEISTQANKLDKDKTEQEIENLVKVKADDIGEITSNSIKHKIVSTGGTTNDPTTGEVQEGTYTISGTAWLDSNSDGRMDKEESTLGNIDMMLINAENGQIVKDIVTGNQKMLATDEEGNYTFANLKPGKYIVVYLYDTTNYSLTEYKKQGVSENANSDAVAMKVKLNGETIDAATSDSLEITNENIKDINLGLTVSKKFDLKLDKVVSKVTVTDSKGTKTNDAKDAKLAKVDLNSKTINGASVVIEYKIRITNEGAVAGYAKKIVDYLPKEMKFSSELNKDWYQAEDGNIYNSSLANTIIAPGETKELTLLLTKQMTDESTGNINNTAEIYEAYNDLGIKDVDSTPANKVQNEDDMSSADVILGIKTGEIYVYILITVITIGIFGAGIYLINKKVLKNV